MRSRKDSPWWIVESPFSRSLGFSFKHCTSLYIMSIPRSMIDWKTPYSRWMFSSREASINKYTTTFGQASFSKTSVLWTHYPSCSEQRNIFLFRMEFSFSNTIPWFLLKISFNSILLCENFYNRSRKKNEDCGMWWLMLCVNLIGQRGDQIAGIHYFWVCLWGCFWKRLAIQSVVWVKVTLPNADEH